MDCVTLTPEVRSPIDWDVINRDHCSRLVVVALTCDFHMIWKNTSDTKASAAVVKN